jgi:hypothetical protein
VSRDVIYPESELAQRHHAGVRRETRDPQEAYAEVRDDVPVGFDTPLSPRSETSASNVLGATASGCPWPCA